MNRPFNIKDIQKTITGVESAYELPAKKGAKGVNWDILNTEIKLFGSQVNDKVKELFYLELATLMDAGVDTRTALELIISGQTKKKNIKTFNDIYQLVINGSTFSAALRNNQDFTSYEYYSVQIGEETGKLSFILNELAVYYKQKIKQRQQIINALAYPVIILLVASLAVSFMVAYVVPMFADVFKRFGGELPFVTRMVLYISAIVRKWFVLFVFTILLGSALCFFSKDKKWYRSLLSRLILNIPVIGAITQKVYLSRFCSTMSLLVSSQIPIVRGIEMVRQMIGYYPIESSLLSVEQDVLSGVSFSKSLEQHSVYPRKMTSLLKAGEEVNKLELFFSRLAEQYTSDVDYQTSLLSKFLEPLIIVILGLVVGIILIAMYLPLFKMGQNI